MISIFIILIIKLQPYLFSACLMGLFYNSQKSRPMGFVFNILTDNKTHMPFPKPNFEVNLIYTVCNC